VQEAAMDANKVRMTLVYYDLSELYLRSRGKIKYYGIARVVAELAYEISLLDKHVRYVVFDSGRRQFFQVGPSFGAASANGLVELGIPDRGIPLRIAETRPTHSAVRRIAQTAVGKVFNIVNRLMFPDIGQYLQPVSLDEGVLFSAARPKFIAEMAGFLKETGSTVKLSAMIYDMIPLHDDLPIPGWFRQTFLDDNARILAHADRAVSISHFTDKDLGLAISQGKLPAPKSRAVVQLCHECRPDGETADIVLPARPYFLGVGITIGRKNLNVVLAAIIAMLEAGKEPPLFVVAGVDRRRNRKALEGGQFAKAAPHVHFVSAPNQANLIALYENALGTVMASKLEGWGLPLGESLWLGTPGISAPNSSLTEVGRDLALYFDADSPRELAEIFDKCMNDQAFYTALKKRVVSARPHLRSWKDVAADLLQTLKSIQNPFSKMAAE
jgi:glycosyltransferase involved in cell wall biosynthesis